MGSARLFLPKTRYLSCAARLSLITEIASHLKLLNIGFELRSTIPFSIKSYISIYNKTW